MIQRERISRSLIAVFALGIVSNALAVVEPSRPALTNLDARQKEPGRSLPAEKRHAAAELRNRLPQAQIDFDEITASPKRICTTAGFLTGANGVGRAVSEASLRRFRADDAHRATKAFLTEHKPLFGYGPEVLQTARVKGEYVAAHNGLHTVIWEQQLDGISVFDAVLLSHTTKRGELVSLSSQFVQDAASAANKGHRNKARKRDEPKLSAAEAVIKAAQHVGEPLAPAEIQSQGQAEGAERKQRFKAKHLTGDTGVKLVWLPMRATEMRLCWDVILSSGMRGEMFRLLIDAETGDALVRHGLTDYASEATFRVYTSDSPSPFSPGHAAPSTLQPPLLARELVTLAALNPNASPLGWINEDDNETRGNNVDAHSDRDDDNEPDLPRPQGSPFRVFDFPLDLTQHPTNYTEAAIVQLFYWCNWMHDRLYELGFTEAAGNFQRNNFGRGGQGNDPVNADAQDGGFFSNANFSTPPDGEPGRMQMFIWTEPYPDRDGDLDAEVILHEYTHGMTRRRVGGGIGFSALQSLGMNEGWSDFFALSMLSQSGDDADGVYAMAGYSSYLLGRIHSHLPAQCLAHNLVPRELVIYICDESLEPGSIAVRDQTLALGFDSVVSFVTDYAKSLPTQTLKAGQFFCKEDCSKISNVKAIPALSSNQPIHREPLHNPGAVCRQLLARKVEEFRVVQTLQDFIFAKVRRCNAFFKTQS